ncbi:hypothetical protein V6R97_13255 [Chromohalobacter salexigens]|uniref:hypothetical protein n=1 Tax=Chromohalobacter israelensis TaxID=141390 RepID=UPI0032E8704B
MKAHLLNKILDEGSLEKIQEAIKGKYELLWMRDIDSVNISHDIVVVVYPINDEEVQSVNEAIVSCGAAGLKVVAVYLENIGGIPEEIEVCGYASFPVTSSRVDDLADGESVWEKPDGTEAEYKDIKRNRC